MPLVLLLLIIGITAEHLLAVPCSKLTSGIVLFALLLLTALLRRWRWVAGVLLCCAVVTLGILITKNDNTRYTNGGSTLPFMTQIDSIMNEKRAALSAIYAEQGLHDNEYAVAMAMTLGEKQHVTYELRDIYSITGGSHVFALSGMHLGILFMLLTIMLPTCSMPRLSVVVQLLVLWTYVLLVGMHASVLRAAIMLSLYSVVTLFRHRPQSINILCITAFLLLVIEPRWLFDVGFQMSFMAVVSIILLYPRLNRAVTHALLKERDPDAPFSLRRYLVTTLISLSVLSLTAQLGVAPLIAHYFHRFSCYFWLTNLFVSPLAFVILAAALMMFLTMGLAGLTGITLLTYLSTFFAWTLKTFIAMLNTILAGIAQLPAASIDDISLNTAQTILTYVLITAIVLLLRKFKQVLRKSVGQKKKNV